MRARHRAPPILAALAALGFAGLLLGPAPIRAQETFTVELAADAGAPGVDIFAYTNQGKTRLAGTGTTGSATVPMDLVNIGKGTRVDVWVRKDDAGQPLEVVFAEPGRRPEECDEDEEEDCERIGSVLWGEGVRVVVRDGRITLERTTHLAKGFRRTVLGVGGGMANFTDLEETGCDGISGCQVTDRVFYSQARAEWWATPFLGLALDATAAFGLKAEGGTGTTGSPERTFTEWGLGLFPVVGFQNVRWGLQAFGGPALSVTRMTARANGSEATGTDTAIQPVIGAAVDYFPLGRVGFRLEFTRVGLGGDPDIQNQTRFAFKFLFPLGSNPLAGT